VSIVFSSSLTAGSPVSVFVAVVAVIDCASLVVSMRSVTPAAAAVRIVIVSAHELHPVRRTSGGFSIFVVVVVVVVF